MLFKMPGNVVIDSDLISETAYHAVFTEGLHSFYAAGKLVPGKDGRWHLKGDHRPTVVIQRRRKRR